MATVERGQRLRVRIEAMGRLGEGLARVEEKPIFVFGGILGEEVVVEVIRERRQYIAAEVIEVIQASQHRVEAPCRYFGTCTGCQWQHVDYANQLELKQQAVEDALQRVGGFSDIPVRETLASPQQYGYRNHARFTIGPQGRLGFVHRERRRFVDIERCMLMDPWINDTLGKLQGRCAETTQLSVRYGTNSGSWLVQPTLTNPDIPLKSGQKHYRETLDGVDFRVAASSFFQVNSQQSVRMAGLVREQLHLHGREVVVDAYAGVGTFAALLAPHTGRVIAIEESASAIKDAQENLAGFDNVVMRQGKTEIVFGELTEAVDAVVLDPPRAGCQPQALESLIRVAPARVVYISCDPETLARDLKVLATGPYAIESVQPVDMFPQTHHVECVATLSLKAGFPITLASSSPRREQILEEAGVPFTITAPQTDEAAPVLGPEAHVIALAEVKARQVAASVRRGLVLGADTAVVDGGTVLGKPSDEADAMEMLLRLKGREHRVLTGVAVVDAVSGESATGVSETRVTMRSYTNEEAWTFVASGEAMDKAGAYAVQHPTFRPAASVEGCYLNVVGLPLCLSVGLLKQLGAELSCPTAPKECPNCSLRVEPA
ncbi:MAG: 23S rRNA (uracil(1939)-C(5))-methyltransferase RlmD [Dehalococcoidia bacterium]